MNGKYTAGQMVMIVLATILLTLGVQSKGCDVSLPDVWNWDWNIVSSAPFKTDKPAAMVIEDALKRDQLPKSQSLAIMDRSWKDYLGESQWAVIDVNNPPQGAETWRQEAWKVKRDSVPWIVGADSHGHGFSQALPATSEEVMSLVKKLVK